MSKREKIYLILIFLFFLLTRFLPYINNAIPTGYDGGIYLYIFKAFVRAFPNFPQFENWILGNFSPGLLLIFYPFAMFKLNPEFLIISLNIILQCLLFFTLFYIVRQIFDTKSAILSIFLLAVSPIQFRTFWFFYLKNVVGLVFLLLTLFALSKKNYKLTIFFAVFTAFFHLPTFLLLGLTLAILLLLSGKEFVSVGKTTLIILFISSVLYLPLFKDIILPYIKPVVLHLLPFKGMQSIISGGTFYSLKTCLLLTIFYLPLSILGLMDKLRDKKFLPFFAFLISAILANMPWFIFHNRFFVQFELVLLPFTAWGIYLLFEKSQNKKEKSVFFAFYLILLIFMGLGFDLKTNKPILRKEEFSSIKQLANLEPEAFLLSPSAEYSAWLIGYSDKKVIAPKYGGYDKYWNTNDWRAFWASDEINTQIELLQKLPQPLYIFLGRYIARYEKLYEGNSCFEKANPFTYRFICVPV